MVVFLLSVGIPLILARASWSADFKKGYSAYKKGDYETSFREWKPFAERGDANAQYNLAWMYQTGMGVSRDQKIAISWFRLAAEQGLADAQYYLGLIYDKGLGVPKDYVVAAKWIKLAAEQGLASAQGSLAAMYAFGDGVPLNLIYAHMWGDLGASNGDPKGARLRDFVGRNMTATELRKARSRARECISKKYKGC